MSEHISAWLGAYLDGELQNPRLAQIEAHLAGCVDCQEELKALQDLSDLLREAPEPTNLPSALRFAAELAPRLPARPLPPLRRTALELSWWLAPLGILCVLLFVEVVFQLSGWVSIANSMGLLGEVASSWLPPASASIWVTPTLGQFGLLPGGASQGVAQLGELIGQNLLSQLTWQAPVAMLYLSWLVIWLSRQQRQRGWAATVVQK
jgi:TRAP-type uncharacterized transport system fused permease subunit